MEKVINYIDLGVLLEGLGYLVVTFALFLLGKLFYSLLNPKINIGRELVEKDNFAFIISYVGYFSALIIILLSVLSGKSYGFIEDLKLISIYGILGMLLLHVAIRVTNALILPTFSIKKEILEDQNEGAGVIEAAVFIGNGFLMYGALIGESSSLLEGIITFIAYWLVGNLILVLSTKVFTAWLKYDIHAEIEKDNIAAGIAFSGTIIATSLVVMNASLDPFVDWLTSCIDILMFSVLGIVLLPIMRLVIDKIILPNRNLTEEIVHQEKPNLGAGLLEAFAYISGAILIVWIF